MRNSVKSRKPLAPPTQLPVKASRGKGKVVEESTHQQPRLETHRETSGSLLRYFLYKIVSHSQGW